MTQFRSGVSGGWCCALLTLAAPTFPADANPEKWLLMSRHGECTEIAVLERKVANIDGINSPGAFIRIMRQRGYDVTDRIMPELGGDAVQVDVEEKGLSLLFVRARLCRGIDQGEGGHDAVLIVTGAPDTLQ